MPRDVNNIIKDGRRWEARVMDPFEESNIFIEITGVGPLYILWGGVCCGPVVIEVILSLPPSFPASVPLYLYHSLSSLPLPLSLHKPTLAIDPSLSLTCMYPSLYLSLTIPSRSYNIPCSFSLIVPTLALFHIFYL